MMKDFFIAHNRNPNFTGRDQILNDLQTALDSKKSVVLVGPDGSGKTQIADEYARVHVTDYDIRCWIRANDPITLITDYADMAISLGLPYNEESNLTYTAEAVQDWLGQNGRWLLVFDDASSFQDLKDYIPQTMTGHVIITSRSQDWNEISSQIRVESLDRSESVQFLQKQTGQEDEEELEALAEALSDLPLALELARAYISWTKISLSKYLKSYLQRLRNIRSVPGCPDAVVAAWDISSEQVQAVSQEENDLLNFCSFLAPEDIPIDLLAKASGLSTEDLETGIESLGRYGLIIRRDNSLSVHTLIQALTFHRLDIDNQKTYAESVLESVGGVFSVSLENISTWPECDMLLSHALTISEHAEKLEVGSKVATLLLNQIGLYLHRRGYFAGSKVALERLLAIDEKAYGPDHVEVATDLNNLGSVLRALGDLSGAKKNFEKALAIEESAEEPDHLKIATRSNNLGSVLRALGDIEGAKRNFEKALAIDKAAYGPNHFKTAIRINNLGDVLRDMGDIEGAKNNYQRALLIFQKFLGEEHHYTQRAQENLNSLSSEKNSDCHIF
ncbi:MAG: FxSxx-COOH system tetratricopeptide repeat protein [Methanotrichaceae archaeon]